MGGKTVSGFTPVLHHGKALGNKTRNLGLLSILIVALNFIILHIVQSIYKVS